MIPTSANGIARDSARHVRVNNRSAHQEAIDLSVSNVRKAFESPAGEQIEVLRGISFNASVGQMTAVIGASGAGKSTLLHILGALESADTGEISLGSYLINATGSYKSAHLRNQHIGFVFQFHHLLADFTAVENVALPAMIARVPRKKATLRASTLLEEFGLGHRMFHPIAHLSGGEQQRVAVARAMINKPILVLADEPTGNLDSAIGEEISGILYAYCRRNNAIIIVATHNERLAKVCDQTLLLLNGKLNRL